MNSTYRIAALSLLLFTVGFFSGYAIPRPGETTPAASESDYSPTTQLMLDFGPNKKPATFLNIPIKNNSSVLDVLIHLLEQDTIVMSYTDYGSGMGVLIESINGYENGSPKNTYWQYWVNNEYATVGVSHHLVSDGDTIYFKFTKQLLSNK